MVVVVPWGAQVQVFKEALAEAFEEAWDRQTQALAMEEVLEKSPAKEAGVNLAPLVMALSLPPWVLGTVESRVVPI